MSTVPHCPLPLGERVTFDLIGRTESGHELRAWTDGDRVVWKDDEGRSGYMPAMLFRAAAFAWARRCEAEACPDDDGDKRDDFLDAWADSIKLPIELAAAHPYWTDPDDNRNDLRFGFASSAESTAIDGPPTGLKERPL